MLAMARVATPPLNWWWTSDFDLLVSSAIVVTLFVSPTSWESYELLLVMLVALLLHVVPPRPSRWLARVWVVVTVLGLYVTSQLEDLGPYWIGC